MSLVPYSHTRLASATLQPAACKAGSIGSAGVAASFTRCYPLFPWG